MPADANPSGDNFGGWLMAQMDLAAGNLAARASRGRSATIAVEGMTFHKPVKGWEEMSLYADMVSTGRTSMRIHVDAWRRNRYAEESVMVTDATFTFLVLDSEGRPASWLTGRTRRPIALHSGPLRWRSTARRAAGSRDHAWRGCAWTGPLRHGPASPLRPSPRHGPAAPPGRWHVRSGRPSRGQGR